MTKQYIIKLSEEHFNVLNDVLLIYCLIAKNLPEAIQNTQSLKESMQYRGTNDPLPSLPTARELRNMITISKRRFICKECRDVDYVTYMVRDDVWKEAGLDNNDFAHIECLEKRLSRKLVQSDFLDSPINRDILLMMRRGNLP